MELFKKCATCDGDGSVIVDLDCGCCQDFRDCAACDGVGFYKIDWELSAMELQQLIGVALVQGAECDERALWHLREAYSFLF